MSNDLCARCGSSGYGCYECIPKTYTRADMEAAIKRALEVAAKKIATQRGTVYDDDSPETIKWINGNNSAVSSALAIIRALDPAQFIEEKKP